MPNIKFAVNVARPIADMSKRSGSALLRYVANYMDGLASGEMAHMASVLSIDNSTTLGSGYLQFASGMLTFVSGSGAVGATIGGTAKTVTWGTSDTASMTAWVAAVNADATISKLGTATNKVMKLTTATAIAGNQFRLGNSVFTGVAGTPANFGEFRIDTGDTETGLSIVNAINKNPGTALRYVAMNIAGAVYIALSNARTPDLNVVDSLKSYASTITVNTAVPTAGFEGFFITNTPGLISNFVTFVKSGTGAEDYTIGTAGQLGGGLGGPSGTLSTSNPSGVYLTIT